MTKNIFLSYARNDSEKALDLYKYLKDQGFLPWLDKEDLLPGQEWKAEIKKTIRASAIFIVCLSNNSVNKQGFVQVELKEALDVAEEMPEGVIYIIPVRFDDCTVPDRLRKYQWLNYFDISEREKLKRAIESRVKTTQVTEIERYFDAGERVKTIRNELGLQTSQFIEILDLKSQRRYEAMENRVKEFPLSLLKKASNTFGIRLDWLKHGKGARYEIKHFYFLHNMKDVWEHCQTLGAQKYYLTLNKDDLHLCLVAQISKYQHHVMDFFLNLDFWDWKGGHKRIPDVYLFLRMLSESGSTVSGLTLPAKYDKELFDGAIHFLTAKKHTDWLGQHLLDDLLDIEEKKGNLFDYSNRYGNLWMQKVHQEFRKYPDQEEARNTCTGSKRGKRRLILRLQTYVAFDGDIDLQSYQTIQDWISDKTGYLFLNSALDINHSLDGDLPETIVDPLKKKLDVCRNVVLLIGSAMNDHRKGIVEYEISYALKKCLPIILVFKGFSEKQRATDSLWDTFLAPKIPDVIKLWEKDLYSLVCPFTFRAVTGAIEAYSHKNLPQKGYTWFWE